MAFNRNLYFGLTVCPVLLHLVLGDCMDFDLGMQSGSILDIQLTASSQLNANTPVKNSRLNTAGPSWCASTSDSNPYLQIDLQTLHIICAVSTQGNSQADQWVQTYTLQSSTDGTIWTDYKEEGRVKIFMGNDDRNTEKKNIIYNGLLTRWLRFRGRTSHNLFCLRAEVFGVELKPENLAISKATAQSSTYSVLDDSSKAVDGNLNPYSDDSRGRCAHTNDDNPSWWRVDLGSDHVPVFEVHIINRFSPHDSVRQRNQDYKITLGNNADVTSNPECVGRYTFIQFVASAVCYSNPLRTGRYVGIMTTKRQILTLCEVEVYSRENLAYGKPTEQTSMVWGGVSSRAVDGNSNTIYDAGLTCTHTLDEMNPWWRVDLGRVEPVTEVYLVSRGDCCEHSLSLFEIRVGSIPNNGGVLNPNCGGDYSVPKGRGASFFCHPTLYGRYVTIRITKRFSEALMLCEVEVYSARRACQVQALGLASRYAFPNSSFSASSSRAGSEASKGRLNGNGAWSPSTDNDNNDFLQINVQYEFFICAVATQGNPDADHWTTKYKLLLSMNSTDWFTYQENGTDKIFNGNGGRNDIVKHTLVGITPAKFIRFQPTNFSTHKALRVEVYGLLKPAVPREAPANFTVTAASSTSITANWQLPPADARNGNIIGYKLFYKKKNAASSPTTVLRINDEAIHTKTVTGLEKYTDYEFQVLAFTSVGDGPKSFVQTERTKEGDPPVVLELNKRTVVPVGKLAILTCEVSGDPQPTVTWTKDGDTNIPRAHFQNGGRILAIQGVLPKDKGVYECKASNKFGESRTATTVTVAVPPSIMEDASPSSVICQRQALCSVHCFATSDYPVTYSWKKNGQIPASDDVKVTNNSIAIRPRDANDYGVYECNATNSYGSTVYKITLSECPKCSTAADTTKENDNQHGTFRLVVIALSCVIGLLLIVIVLLLWRLRRALPEKANTSVNYTSREDGQNGAPRDQCITGPDPYMELHPRPSQGQSHPPPRYQSLQGNNTASGYYNVGFRRGNEPAEQYEEVYDEIRDSRT